MTIAELTGGDTSTTGATSLGYGSRPQTSFSGGGRRPPRKGRSDGSQVFSKVDSSDSPEIMPVGTIARGPQGAYEGQVGSGTGTSSWCFSRLGHRYLTLGGPLIPYFHRCYSNGHSAFPFLTTYPSVPDLYNSLPLTPYHTLPSILLPGVFYGVRHTLLSTSALAMELRSKPPQTHAL